MASGLNVFSFKKFYQVFIASVLLLSFSASEAATVRYDLNNVIQDSGAQLTGTFYWTYDEGNFENGTGEFSQLYIPGNTSSIDGLTITIDASGSIEFSLTANVHSGGITVTLFLESPLSPVAPTPMDLSRSAYEIEQSASRGGFISGSIVPDLSDLDSDNDGLLDSQEDINRDGVVDAGETDPLNPDSDGDRLLDGYEVRVSGTDPLNPDTDTDGVFDDTDNCALTLNPGQLNHDGDVYGSACDNCITVTNPDQRDTNNDGFGNICDADVDNDGLVTRIDLQVIYRLFGRGWPDADLNGDGNIDGTDFYIAKSKLGTAPGPAAP